MLISKKASKYFVVLILSGHQLIALGSKYKMYRSSFINPFFYTDSLHKYWAKSQSALCQCCAAAVKMKHTQENTHEFASVRHVETSVDIQKKSKHRLRVLCRISLRVLLKLQD